jgi:hypothetical protein
MLSPLHEWEGFYVIKPVLSDHVWHAVVTMGLLFIGIHDAWDAAVWITTQKPEKQAG